MTWTDRDNRQLKSIVFERNTFLGQSASLTESLREMWAEDNANHSEILSVQLDNQIQYICSEG